VRYRLLGHLAEIPMAMTLDLLAGELLTATLDIDARRLYKPRQLSWYARRIDRARAQMDDNFASDQTLAALAREAGMSPFHFAHIFRALTGVPPHRYLIARRLEAAKRRLRDGDSVTNTCYAVGFRSLSHFITSFRSSLGCRPRSFNEQQHSHETRNTRK
jgi:AraC-like DNA-binding protein